jgi:hypothetical protein
MKDSHWNVRQQIPSTVKGKQLLGPSGFWGDLIQLTIEIRVDGTTTLQNKVVVSKFV